MTKSDKVKRIAKVLRERFIGLNEIDAVDLAYHILVAIEESPALVEIKPSERT